ncbi:hypothetical protein KAFR_0J00810 [Kazachstania africana CBS 2517]|uniref:Uncharacterized protein n=1 Tax=Kazachstania africana (strain ATCC 22294 / BCRC 22015 / CBS 2517 / CECT 1963 / NBRC 1671 / NRRL Y-8276) TaxID=1071382 RepID=H2B0J9_KAZAF|nr:hypothetical protein KAFR_0J00810 [Kazachstania africana CBS 2517]CCF60149.1 hypothetical protein KAFR_0J00810 [Kazachstania africana CBS 2517]
MSGSHSKVQHAPTSINNDKFLKVSPSLFTPERLDLFDSMDLYTTLMKSNKFLENGDRLSNISLRIVNKALLKYHSVNRPKKRDGVKNVYHVLNSASLISGTTQPPATKTQHVETRPMILRYAPARPTATTTTRPQALKSIKSTLTSISERHQSQVDTSLNPKTVVTGFKPNTLITNTAKPQVVSRQESLFSNTSSHEQKIFFSSEDDLSDWNISVSDDDDDDDDEDYEEDDEDDEDDDDDDEDEDKFYKKQLDKLLFAKTSSPGSSSSHNDHTVKKSLLSGLFSSGPPVTHQNVTSSPHNMTTLETSNVIAVGSVTPPHQLQAKEVIKRTTGSFSSIVSENTRDRYAYESNAPLTAKTILPTALSTHMFIPNSVHQMRMDAATRRRGSIDIPNKNRNGIKTRMELSEEASFNKHTRRGNNNNMHNNIRG